MLKHHPGLFNVLAPENVAPVRRSEFEGGLQHFPIRHHQRLGELRVDGRETLVPLRQRLGQRGNVSARRDALRQVGDFLRQPVAFLFEDGAFARVVVSERRVKHAIDERGRQHDLLQRVEKYVIDEIDGKRALGGTHVRSLAPTRGTDVITAHGLEGRAALTDDEARQQVLRRAVAVPSRGAEEPALRVTQIGVMPRS